MGADSAAEEWVSQREAAALAGVPVATVEFAARSGHFTKRAEAPSLSRDSVLAWAERRAARKSRAEARRRPARPRPPEPTGWLSIDEAKAVLGVGRATVFRFAHAGRIEKRRNGRHQWIREQDVRRLAAERAEWISAKQAAELVGCSVNAIFNAAYAGRIEQREAVRALPSLKRSSVERFAVEWTEEQRRAGDRRRQRQERKSTPPDDRDVWLSQTTTALVLGLSRSRVGEMTRRGTIPHTRKGRRYWYRRSHVEQLAAARAARRVRDSVAPNP